jgi:hypothetical protein
MPSIDERVAYLEGKTEDHSGAVGELRDDMRDIRVEVRELRGEVRELRSEMGRRFEAADARVDRVDTKINWAIGMQVGTLLAVLGAFLSR